LLACGPDVSPPSIVAAVTASAHFWREEVVSAFSAMHQVVFVHPQERKRNCCTGAAPGNKYNLYHGFPQFPFPSSEGASFMGRPALFLDHTDGSSLAACHSVGLLLGFLGTKGGHGNLSVVGLRLVYG